ncbi:S8 family serine peptidase [Hymenobacter terricola]|uniref:S8 family serine peptidase n=1 Tax=Hymenobacter terricola TaxID=2819236 RepID=UPI001B30E083|nr:S8 family serine peptidase [Hymenobacter terricola]
MAKKDRNDSGNESGANHASSSVEDLLLAALERGDESGETGRYLVTFKEGAGDEGLQSLRAQGMRVADARDFTDQAVAFDNMGDANTIIFPEIGVALIGGEAAQERNLGAQAELATDSPMETIEAERFVFADAVYSEYLRGMNQAPEMVPREYQNGFTHQAESPSNEYMHGFLRAAELIAKELRNETGGSATMETDLQEEVLVLGATWGLTVCKVPPSLRSGLGIKVAVLDTGFDLGHPDFVGRSITGATFVGQPVQDVFGHGTHVVGTACGPKAPAGTTPRYGIGYRTSIFTGKVLNNSGAGTSATVLAGMNWAIANRCQVISMSLGGPGGPLAAYTAAGQAALNNGLLMIAAAGNNAGTTGNPANSPTIMSVAALDPSLNPSNFSNFGKIDIAGPGRDVFSSWPRPTRYRTISGTSMATPHVAGCAALWAESASSLRGLNLWRKLQATARHLPYSATRVGAGLVQAP